MIASYPRFLKEGFTPHYPVELATMTELIVCKDDSRKYTHFYCTGVYGGISTEIGYKEYLEEEICDPYDTTLIRLKAASLDIFKT
ncbi:TPA: hypothetical protein DCX16_06700 [bacterium]|nr:hypothetical protein [bacterium]